MRMTRTLALAGALVVSAFLGGTLINAALATETDTPTNSDDERGASCDVFLDAFAADLGVSTDDVTAAGKAGAMAVIDAALAAGDITDAQAERLRARVTDADGSGCGLFKAGWLRGFVHGAGHGTVRGWAHGFLGGDVLEAAADAFGIESSALIEQLRDAGSLEALATDLGASYDDVKASILGAVQADLDASNLSDERKERIIERLNGWLDDGGKVGGSLPGRGHLGPRQRDDAGADDQGA